MNRILFVIAVVVCMPLTSQAQPHLDNQSDTFWLLFEEQTLRVLGYPSEGVLNAPPLARAYDITRVAPDGTILKTLENTIVVAVTHRDKMNFDRMVGPIIDLHRKNKNPEVKQMALGALQIIGTDRALAYARRAASPEDREASRTDAVAVINNHFTERDTVTRQAARQ